MTIQDLIEEALRAAKEHSPDAAIYVHGSLKGKLVPLGHGRIQLRPIDNFGESQHGDPYIGLVFNIDPLYWDIYSKEENWQDDPQSDDTQTVL